MNRRTVLFGVLYASEGAPIGFIWWALPTLLRSADVPVARITSLTALLLLPWVFKFLWAPLLDVMRGPSWGYRSWLVTMQSVMGLSLVPLVWLDPVADFDSWRILLIVHALAAATQDIAIDALAIGAVPAAERGRLNGAMQAGMLVGRSLFGGGILLVGGFAGRSAMVAALTAWILVALGAALRLDKLEPPRDGVHSLMRSARVAVRERRTWLGLAFALLAAAGFEATGQLAGPFLVDRGVPNETIGVFFGIFVVAAMLVGGVAGGLMADRWARTTVAALGLCGFVTAIVLLAVADLSGSSGTPLRIGLLTLMYFFVGQFTASSYAIFMDLTHPRIAATQFTAFMAGTNACESWSAWSAGLIVSRHGYPASFLVMCAISMLGLPLLLRIRRVNTDRSEFPSSSALRYDAPRGG
jgi:MFS family permease